MSRFVFPVFLIAVFVGPLAYAEPVLKLSDQAGQLGTAIEWMAVPGEEGLVHMIQRSRDGRLFLTPNAAFFPGRGLKAEGSGSIPDGDGLNGGQSFATIGDWDEGDVAEWGLWFEEPGEIEVHVWMSGDAGGEFKVRLGEAEETFSVRSGNRESAKASVSMSMRVSEPGRHSLLLSCEEGGTGAALHWIEVEGAAAKQAGVLRKRWRPAAAHGRFSSSRASRGIRLWVMEMDAVPGELSFYSPLTTPFGYYGPSWMADGRVNTSFNFSLWSFGRGKEEPPIEELSHLIAIGDPDASFGGFDHEGTGVKVRDWEPLEGRQGQRQTMALRVEPGDRYDTYFSYFYATDEKRWRLFGVGKKHHGGKPLKSLWVGSFVEVPGPPQVQRTGPYERRMRYRGWVMEEGGRWFPLDRLSVGDVDKETGLTYTDRGETEDGWFYMETGGWVFRKAPTKEYVELSPPRGRPEVAYLDAEDVAYLKTIPCAIAGLKLERGRGQARVRFEIRHLGDKPEVLIYWGGEEGLTFEERWEERATMREPREGENEYVIDGVPDDAPLFVRLFIKNEEGQFWSTDTLSAGR
jgi:hypothetical protein